VRIIGADLSGAESLASICDDTGTTALARSCAPHRPASILLPLIRSEQTVAGDRALLLERGLGLPWPPLAHATATDMPEPPVEGSQGRVLIASAWHRLATATDWQASKWSPPDGLPKLTKPSPASCIEFERRALVAPHIAQNPETSIVLAVPNHLPEESQQALLNILPPGSRLVWRAVAAAMQYLDRMPHQGPWHEQLAVIDVGPSSIERSTFSVRREVVAGKPFFVPVRRSTECHHWPIAVGFFETAFLPAGFAFDARRMKSIAGEVLEEFGKCSNVVCCGPGAAAFLSVAVPSERSIRLTATDQSVIAKGATLLGWRLAHRLPTYRDVLSSLELFVTNRHREPEWLEIIPTGFEIEGGQDYEKRFERVLAVKTGTDELENWLRRSGETDLRLLTTKLTRVASAEVPVDLRVVARSAGGLARLEVSPSDGRSDIFGESRRLPLNWLSMKREKNTPSGFPGETKFGWPNTGELEGPRTAFLEFLRLGEAYFQAGELGGLRMLESVATKSTPVTALGRVDHRDGIEAGTVPIRSLPCFGSGQPCRFFEGGVPSETEVDRLNEIGARLWRELRTLESTSGLAQNRHDRNRKRPLVRILGRMGLHSPAAFAGYVAENLTPRLDANLLFAAGRVFRSPDQARLLFKTVRLKAELNQSLTTPWLRVFDYLLFQRPDILESTPREDLVVATKLCFGSLQGEIAAAKFKVKFGLSVRAIARLLRSRRHHSNFVSLQEGSLERNLATQIQSALDDTLAMLPAGRDGKGVLRNNHARLCELTKDWLLTRALTNVLGAPDDEESDDGGDGDSSGAE
jgi:hypothetical protein